MPPGRHTDPNDESRLADLLQLPIDALERTVHALEQTIPVDHSRALQHIQMARRLLSSMAWDSYSAAAYQAYGGPPPPIARTGHAIGAMDQDSADRFNRLLESAPLTEIRLDDHASGYMATNNSLTLRRLNEFNLYYDVTPAMVAALTAYLTGAIGEIERLSGHFWTVGSVRCFALKPGQDLAVHTDEWPGAMKKLFILPRGIGREKGSTYLKLRTGEEIIPESEGPTWLIFENGTIPHAAIAPRTAPRPTIEVDLLPAMRTDPTAVFVGTNSWYPWFPAQSDPGVYQRGLKRIVTLAAGAILPDFPTSERTYPLTARLGGQPLFEALKSLVIMGHREEAARILVRDHAKAMAECKTATDGREALLLFARLLMEARSLACLPFWVALERRAAVPAGEWLRIARFCHDRQETENAVRAARKALAGADVAAAAALIPIFQAAGDSATVASIMARVDQFAAADAAPA